MGVASTQALLADTAGLRQQARADRRATSAPLIAFGLLTVLDAGAQGLANPTQALLLIFLGPAGFVLLARYYRRRELATGVGTRSDSYVRAGLVSLGVILMLPFLALLPFMLGQTYVPTLVFGPFGLYGLVGVSLLVLALNQRNAYLGAWALLYGIVGCLEGLSLVSNELYATAYRLGLFRSSDGYFPWGSSIVYAAMGLAMTGVGLYVRRGERGVR